jgi:hypothetical protein
MTENPIIAHYSKIYLQEYLLINSLSKLDFAGATSVCCHLLQKNKRSTKLKLPSNKIC